MSRKTKSQTTGVRYTVLRNISLLEGKDIPAGSTVTGADVFGKAEILLQLGLITPVPGGIGTPTLTEETE